LHGGSIDVKVSYKATGGSITGWTNFKYQYSWDGSTWSTQANIPTETWNNNQVKDFNYTITLPSTSGSYTLRWRVVNTNDNSILSTKTISVEVVDCSAPASNDPLTISSLSIDGASLCLNESGKINLSIKNNTGAAISAGTQYKVEYSWDNSTWTASGVYAEGIADGATKTANFNVTPTSTGNKTLYVRIIDTNNSNTVVTSSSLTFNVVDCTLPPTASLDCNTAPLIQTVGTIPGNTTDYSPNNGSNSWMQGMVTNSSIENVGFFKFVANSSTLKYTFCVTSNCGYSGIQIYLFEQCGNGGSNIMSVYSFCSECGQTTISVGNTNYSGVKSGTETASNSLGHSYTVTFDMNNGQCNTFTVTGLIPGNTYYWALDGNSGQKCPYTLQFTDGISTLPIKLQSIYGTALPQGNEISWITATEQNNAYFELESSVDGINFTKIATIPGAGKSSKLREYSFLDRHPAGLVTYYRLRQVDYNGDSETFDPISVERKAMGEVLVSPNPFQESLNVDADVLTAGIYTFSFTSMSGKSVNQKQYLEQGINHLQLQTTDLAKGFYILRVMDAENNTINTVKVVKE